MEADIKSKQSNENQKTQLNKEMKYLFPSSEVDFKNLKLLFVDLGGISYDRVSSIYRSIDAEFLVNG